MTEPTQFLIERLGSSLPKLELRARERRIYWMDYHNISQVYESLSRYHSLFSKSLALSFAKSLIYATNTEFYKRDDRRKPIEEVIKLLEEIGAS